MSTKAPGINLRYGQLKIWLGENGISEYKMLMLMTQGIIKRRQLGGGEAYYNAEEVQRDVLDRLSPPPQEGRYTHA